MAELEAKKQAEEEAKTEEKEEKKAKKEPEKEIDLPAGEEVSQDDIDALFD